jgi:hypothetical protein
MISIYIVKLLGGMFFGWIFLFTTLSPGLRPGTGSIGSTHRCQIRLLAEEQSSGGLFPDESKEYKDQTNNKSSDILDGDAKLANRSGGVKPRKVRFAHLEYREQNMSLDLPQSSPDKVVRWDAETLSLDEFLAEENESKFESPKPKPAIDYGYDCRPMTPRLLRKTRDDDPEFIEQHRKNLANLDMLHKINGMKKTISGAGAGAGPTMILYLFRDINPEIQGIQVSQGSQGIQGICREKLFAGVEEFERQK